jgi:hypothetical protein
MELNELGIRDVFDSGLFFSKMEQVDETFFASPKNNRLIR